MKSHSGNRYREFFHSQAHEAHRRHRNRADGGPFTPGLGPHGLEGHGFGAGMGRDFWRMFGGSHWGGRMRRGDVRAAILALLREEPRNGYGIIQEIERRSEGLWKPSAGAVYPALQLLEDEGLIEQVDSGGRREHRLTDAGRTYVEENESNLRVPWNGMKNEPAEGVMGLMALVRQVGMAAVQVSQAGSASQVKAAQAVLNDARRTLYGILATEETATEESGEA